MTGFADSGAIYTAVIEPIGTRSKVNQRHMIVWGIDILVFLWLSTAIVIVGIQCGQIRSKCYAIYKHNNALVK